MLFFSDRETYAAIVFNDQVRNSCNIDSKIKILTLSWPKLKSHFSQRLFRINRNTVNNKNLVVH